MIVVSDASPLIVLAKLDCLDVLPKLFASVAVPPEVYSELQISQRVEFADESRYYDWLHVIVPAEVVEYDGLHPGENAAIALVRELKADRLLIDEVKGRAIARQLSIPFMGSIGVLSVAAREGLINLESAFERLKLTDFWVSERLLEIELQNYRDWLSQQA